MTDAPDLPSEIDAVFARYPTDVRTCLLNIRRAIFHAASRIEDVNGIEESLKWGQPSYRGTGTRFGTALRLGCEGQQVPRAAVYVHCGTSLIEDLKATRGLTLETKGNRAILLAAGSAGPDDDIRAVIEAALIYRKG